jgi:two-component system, NarL family, response regulator
MTVEGDARCRVFIVDNNEDLAWSLSALLDMETDLRVVGHCATGAECLARARAAQANIMILDYRLSDCTAIQVLEQARVTAADLGIIIYSGYLSDELAAQAIAAGAAAFVVKGGSFEALADEIRRVQQARAGM